MSPTPPVECLSTVGRSNIDQFIRSPLAIIASVQRDISLLFIPFKSIAINKADICSSAITPLVYASTVQSICSLLNSCLSRFAEIISTAANFSLIYLRSSGPKAQGSNVENGFGPSGVINNISFPPCSNNNWRHLPHGDK